VLQTILLTTEDYTMKMSDLRENFRKTMSKSLSMCFIYPNTFENFIESQKATFVFENDTLKLTDDVIKNLTKSKEKENIINLISDDDISID
jgi:hypothetical protein